jgi:predicted Zn-dependent protease
LIQDDPNNPYFHELKGQILLENGRALEAIPEHQAAVRLLPNEPLFKLNLGQALVATEDPKYAQGAIEILSASVHQDPENTFAWDQLAKAYGELNQIAYAEYATAEKFAHGGAYPEAMSHARRALCGLPKGSPAARRAQDIIETTKAQLEMDGRRSRAFDEEGNGSGARKGPRCEDYGGGSGNGRALRGG